MQLWKEQAPEKRIVISVNSSYGIAPWSDYIFAMDTRFWLVKYYDIAVKCKGKKTTTATGVRNEVERVPCLNPGNSGAGAIGLAAYLGAEKIILLGYDCKYAADGKRHFFGNHPPGMNGNAGSVNSWPDQFAQIARKLMNRCDIVNATRDTKLKCFKLIELETALDAT